MSLFHPSPAPKPIYIRSAPLLATIYFGLLTQSCTGDFPTEIMYTFLVSPTESHTQLIITFKFFLSSRFRAS